MATARLLTVDIRQVAGLADSLTKLDGPKLGSIGLAAVNEVAVRTEIAARRGIAQTINLSESYLIARLGVRRATDASRPEAVIFSPYTQTPLGRYDPKQLTKAVKNPARSKGDRSRGIAPGQKGAGISVEVTRGSRKPITNAFTMPLNNNNGTGVFTRVNGELKYQHRYGPSVYQLFRVQAVRLRDEITTDLQQSLISEAERVLEGVFE